MNISDELKQKMKNIDVYNIKDILSVSRKINKNILSRINTNSNFRIAVVGNISTQFFTSVLKAMLYSRDVEAEFYEGEYDSINIDILDNNSNLYKFKPNIIIVLVDHHIIKQYPDLLISEEEIEKKIDNQLKYFESIWSNIEKNLPGAYILQSNIVLPLESALGNLEANYSFSSRSYLNRINLELINNKGKSVTLVDIESLASYIGKKQWFDESAYMLNKMGFNMDYLGIVVSKFIDQIIAMKGKINKCLVLDLDNTIWGGIVGEDGYSNIQINPNNAIGEAFLTFQKYVLKLKERGVILAVCSKNDEHIAKEPFEKNDNMILKFEDFACFIANWEDKASNIKTIAERLNIGTDSIVFFDDNPAEREIVKMHLPEVRVVEVPKDPANYVRALYEANPFEWIQLTKEDIKRNNTYLENTKREELSMSFSNYDEYLNALDMKASVQTVDLNMIERFTQLLNKSNQFNLRTQRYSESEIRSIAENPNYKLLAVSLNDKFSDYGIVSCVILKKEEQYCFIESWVMSCRVLKRGLEWFTFNHILECANNMECTYIIGEYIPTTKNSLVKNLFNDLNFEIMQKKLSFNDFEKGIAYRCLSNIEKLKNIYIEEI